MARKLSQMDWASEEFSKASSKKAGTYAKKQAKKALSNAGKSSRPTKKSKQEDSDMAVAIVGLAAVALIHSAVTAVAKKVRSK